MIENLRKRNHRIKTVASTITSQPQRTSNYFFENRKESVSFRKSINKVDSFFTHQRTSRIYSSFKCSSKMKKSTSRMRPEPVSHKLLTFHTTGKCNNQQRISKLLEERDRWSRNEGKPATEANFIWGYFNTALSSGIKEGMVMSRIPGSNQMTDKGNLYQNVSAYCEKKGIGLTFMPITFYLNREGPTHQLKANIKQFLYFFNYVKEHTNLSNTWIMKPTNMNQGRDIELFDSLHSLWKLLAHKKIDYLQTQEAIDKKIETQLEFHLEAYITINRSLIMQKYIENPFLIHNHKFDIRIWMLIDHQEQFYMFEEGYLRFSSEPYQLNSKSINDHFMHLTNHALQKYSPHYSKEQCLQPVSVLQDYLQKKGKGKHYQLIMNKIKEIIQIVVKACKPTQKIHKNKCFELFGFDFLIDRELNVRLIQANCNPAISEDNDLLGQLIPKMLNDAFKLTIDRIFNTKSSRLYHVPRLNSQNGWVLLGNLNE